jgi:hypothetical protein
MASPVNISVEKVFSKLPNYGYSQEVTQLIWQWYNPTSNIEVLEKSEQDLLDQPEKSLDEKEIIFELESLCTNYET